MLAQTAAALRHFLDAGRRWKQFSGTMVLFGAFEKGGVQMQRYLVALAALITLAAGTVTTARAVEFDVGPGGVYVGPHRHHYYGSYDSYWNCRVVIDHRTNRYGEDVTVRRRICD
jgi:hypothetical protein